MKASLAWIRAGACSLALAAAAPAARATVGDLVSFADFAAFRRAFLCTAGDACYDANADYDSDGEVGLEDFGYFKIRLQLDTHGGDVTPPAVSIASPTGNQTLSGVVTISVSTTDDGGVGGVEIFFEGIDAYPFESTVAPYRTTLDTRTIPNGVRTLRANAHDLSGNTNSHRIAVQVHNPPPPAAGSTPGVVIADDLNNDGRHTGEDLKIALALCVPGCTLRALARTYDDVEISIPAEITAPLIIEGAGMGQTVFRSPVPWARPVIRVAYPNPLVTFRDLTIDGRKAEQVSSLAGEQAQVGIRVANPWAADTGPGIIERVEVKNMLMVGVAISGGTHWIVRNSKIHDNGCSNRLPCPNLRIIDPGAKLHNPLWQSVGYGMVIEASDTTVHDNEIWNVNKIGIEAYASYLLPYSDVMSGFHFHHNYVHHVGMGIGSNGGRGGWIENNVVTFTRAHGVFCGGQAGDLVFHDNLISDNYFAGLWVSCWGPNITVTDNVIGNNCLALNGGGAGLLVDAGTQFGGGDGLTVQGNFVREPLCRSATDISFHDDIQMSGNDFQGGSSLGTVVLHDSTNIVMSDTHIDGQSRVPAGIFLLPNVDGLTVRSDVTMTGHTQMKVIASDPATATHIVIE